MKEKNGISLNGWLVLLILFVSAVTLFMLMGNSIRYLSEEQIIGLIFPTFLIFVLGISGLYTVEPNESIIQLFLGNYIGTDKKSGFRWTIPFFNKTKASLRIQDFETEMIKVNDLNGNPVLISAIVIWRIKDTYQSYFEVENFTQFLTKQSVAALRGLAMKYPYESFNEYTESLITHTEEVAEALKLQIQEKVDQAGIEILEARINHLSYAKEIAAAMLQRQQASAIISAKKEIVGGAVGMVEMAINDLEEKSIVVFDEVGKRKLVSNLLVVLCSDQGTQPILSTNSD